MSVIRNILGSNLVPCCQTPATGFYRDGYCVASEEDPGLHTVCAVVSKEFLDFTKKRGNDLSTPNERFGFPGLKPGDRWCLCAARWFEAYQAGFAPPVVLDATDEATLDIVDKQILLDYSYKPEE